MEFIIESSQVSSNLAGISGIGGGCYFAAP